MKEINNLNSFTFYTAETLPLFKQYLDEWNNPDTPGYFIPWLMGHKDVYTYRFEGHRYDIWTLES